MHGTSGRTWVIDPVDGTYNFLHGSTYWCSAIALKDAVGRAARAPFSSPKRTSSGWAASHAPATLNGERLTAFQDGRTAATAADPLAELGAATYIHPTWLADPLCAMPGTPPRRPPRRCGCSVRLLRPGPGGRRRARLLVPAQLPRMGLAARQGDRGGRRRRRRHRPRQRPGMVHGRRHDGGARSCVRPSSPARWTSFPRIGSSRLPGLNAGNPQAGSECRPHRLDL